MTTPITYDVTDLDAIVDRAREKLRQKVATDRTLFGDDKGVRQRIANTLESDSPKGTLAAPPGVDPSTAAGIMATVDLTILDHNARTDEVEKIARARQRSIAHPCVSTRNM